MNWQPFQFGTGQNVITFEAFHKRKVNPLVRNVSHECHLYEALDNGLLCYGENQPVI